MILERIQKEGRKVMIQFAIPCVIAMVLTSAITLVDNQNNIEVIKTKNNSI